MVPGRRNRLSFEVINRGIVSVDEFRNDESRTKKNKTCTRCIYIVVNWSKIMSKKERSITGSTGSLKLSGFNVGDRRIQLL